MKLTRLQPFGQHRKTYFYGVAGFVLAAHVVVGGMIFVMPPEGEGQLPTLPTVEMQIIDLAPPVAAVGTRAVDLVEAPVEDLKFEPVWRPRAIEPKIEPVGPTVADLPAVAVVAPQVRRTTEEKKITPQQVKPAPAKPAPVPVVQRREVSRTRPEPVPAPAAVAASPVDTTEVPRAIPVSSPPVRTGMLERIRQRRERNN